MADALKQKECISQIQSYKFGKGDIASIVGIQSKPHWNGNLCIIQSYNKSKQRYHIIFYDKCSNQKEKKEEGLLKQSNLCVIYGSNQYPNIVSCIICDKKRKISSMLDCVFCKSVFYCSSKCQSQHSMRHLFICINYKRFALKEHNIINEMIDLFEFDNLAKYGMESWLKMMNLHNKGIWNRLCQCNKSGFGELKIENNSYEFWGFSKSNSLWIPSFDKQIDSQFIVKNWREYYKLKQLSLESPISHFMSYVMSIYYLLTNYLKIRPIIKCNKNEIKQIVIHLIGVEIELDILILFKEILCLLPGHNFKFYCFGNTDNGHLFRPIAESMNNFNSTFTLNNNHMEFQVFTRNYSEKNIHDMISYKKERIPDLAIALNAGFEGYETAWFDAVSYLRKYNIPSLFTEYTNATIINANLFMMQNFFDQLSVQHIINPFRSPLITYNDGTRFSSIKNGFIYGFNVQ